MKRAFSLPGEVEAIVGLEPPEKREGKLSHHDFVEMCERRLDVILKDPNSPQSIKDKILDARSKGFTMARHRRLNAWYMIPLIPSSQQEEQIRYERAKDKPKSNCGWFDED